MKIVGYCRAGVGTDEYKDSVTFFEKVFGLKLISNNGHRAAFELASGERFSLFGVCSQRYPFHAYPVLGFEVEDIRAAREELLRHDVEVLTRIETTPEGDACFYFRGPEAYVYQLVEVGGARR